jgi:dTMP kinase
MVNCAVAGAQLSPQQAQNRRFLGTPAFTPASEALAEERSCYDQLVLSRGKFVTFEGLDGCGKSTQLNRLANVLRGEGIEVVVTREPGGTSIGDCIRGLLLDSRTQQVSPKAELALMFASRMQNIDEQIRPALEAGKFVLCDRFTDSSEAYQGYGRRLGSEMVLELDRVLCGGLRPDMTVLMDSEIAHSVERARRRNQQKAELQNENRFEQENRGFFERVHEGFLAIAKREPERVFLIDARRAPDVVHEEIVREVRRRFLEPAGASGQPSVAGSSG